jgi:polysaccharide export outer membrane protein
MAAPFAFGQYPASGTAQVDAAQQPSNVQVLVPAQVPVSSEVRYTANAHLGPGDALDIQVFGLPELTQAARVNNAGNLDLPLIGVVPVSNLTIEEARKAIEKKLHDGGFVNEPFVTVTPRDLPSQTVAVMGEVNRPGSFPVADSLAEVIAEAGGPSSRAGHWVQVVHRADPDHPLKVHFDFEDPLAKDSRVDLQPGDTVVVNRAEVVYVIGDVARAAQIVVENDSITVMEALSVAGGLAPTAAPNKATILRRTSRSVKLEVIKVPIKPMMAAKAEDITMHADDILFVPGSLSKALAHGGFQQLLQAASLAALIHAY